MKNPKKAHLIYPIFVLVSTVAFFSCGHDSAPQPVLPPQPQVASTEAETICASPLFGFGRSIPYSELRNSVGYAKYGLESMLFRDVIYRSPNQVELAYLINVKMELQQGQFLVPKSDLLCSQAPRPSRRSSRLSTTMVPVLGDLHIPSARITVYDSNEGDRLYNYPRIAEVSFSSNGYASFNNQNWNSYRRLQTLSDYLDFLRTRHFYQNIDVRDLGPGRIGIVAEKNVGGEITQLQITMVETP